MYIRLLSALLLAVALTTACIKPENKNELVEISNFRFGLVYFDDDQRPHIYKEGDEFPFEENGTCVANGESYPCLWRGFEFSYKSPTEYTKFDCLATLNHPTNHVYPDRVVKENTKTIQYSFVVEGRSGHYIRPQYTYGLKEHPEQSSTVCTANGQQEVLKWKYTLNPLRTAK